MRSIAAYITASVAVLLPLASAKFRVLQPIANAKEYQNSEAQFGLPHYGGSITGQLFYGTEGDRDGCSPFHPAGSGTAPWQEAISAGQSAIVMVDRGNNYTFVQKVRNGQDAAATAIVIVDNKDESFLPIMADDGTGNTIHIPSIFISKASGKELKDLIAAGKKVMVQLSWEVPTTETNVEWEYWMTSNDDSKQFKHDFKVVADKLRDRAHLSAHYLFIPGQIFGCTHETRPCGKQCTNQGRYCAQDPEHDVTTGEDGEDVVAENVRQLCIFKNMQAAKTTEKWWTYIDLFYQHCEPNDSTFNKACSETQQTAAGINVAATNTCVTGCGGTDAEGGVNTCIEAEIAAAGDNGVHVLPSVYVNDRLYYGRLSCPSPVDISTCGVLGQLCAGYAAGFAPEACSSKFCWAGLDECGVCGGKGLKDKCGTCLTAADKTNGNWNKACTGCDGVLNSGKVNDPCGVCGGNGSFDACGACLQEGDSRRQTDGNSCIVSGGSLTTIAIGVSAVMLLVGGTAGFFYIQKREQKMKADMESVLASYMPLDAANDFAHAGDKSNLISSAHL